VVEIHGGPYRFSATARWTATGTAEKPVFIRGSRSPTAGADHTIEGGVGGSYLIVENIELYDDSRFDINTGSPSHEARRFACGCARRSS